MLAWKGKMSVIAPTLLRIKLSSLFENIRYTVSHAPFSSMPDSLGLEQLRAQIDASAAAIFDNDGTMVNTMPSHLRAWQGAVKKYGLHLSEEEFYARAGAPANEIVDALNKAQDKSVTVEQVRSAKAEILAKEIDSIRAIDVVYQLAEYAKSQGIPIAIASGGQRKNVVASLHSAGIDANKYFRAVVTAEDVTHGKPHPETFLLAAERLNVDPKQCIGFEDGEFGLQALRNAGMKDVDVRNLPGYPEGRVHRKP